MIACKQNLIECLKEHPFVESSDNGWYFKRFSVDTPKLDLVEWLNGQESKHRIFFSSADKVFQLAGIGCAATWGELPQIPGLAESGMSCFYTMPFATMEASTDAKWGPFSAPNAFIPLIELTADGLLSVNFILRPGDKYEEQLNIVIEAVAAVMPSKPLEDAVIAWKNRDDRPEFNRWEQSVDEILGCIEQKTIEKVVLARETKFTFSDRVSELSVLRQLILQAPDSNHFLFNIGTGVTFLGATPELLFKRDGNEIFSHAVAATRVRSQNQEEDDRLADEMMNSTKECHEHQLVADMLESRLKPFCSVLSRTPVTVMKLQMLQHLYCEISGTLAGTSTDQDIVTALHPTPAVGGVPTDTALTFIERLEPFSRGCYAAPVGIMQGDRSRFLVAIRSALVSGSHLYTYAGAGIVEGSEALAEWNEVESKIASVRGIFQ